MLEGFRRLAVWDARVLLNVDGHLEQNPQVVDHIGIYAEKTPQCQPL